MYESIFLFVSCLFHRKVTENENEGILCIQKPCTKIIFICIWMNVEAVSGSGNVDMPQSGVIFVVLNPMLQYVFEVETKA